MEARLQRLGVDFAHGLVVEGRAQHVTLEFQLAARNLRFGGRERLELGGLALLLDGAHARRVVVRVHHPQLAAACRHILVQLVAKRPVDALQGDLALGRRNGFRQFLGDVDRRRDTVQGPRRFDGNVRKRVYLLFGQVSAHRGLRRQGVHHHGDADRGHDHDQGVGPTAQRCRFRGRGFRVSHEGTSSLLSGSGTDSVYGAISYLQLLAAISNVAIAASRSTRRPPQPSPTGSTRRCASPRHLWRSPGTASGS